MLLNYFLDFGSFFYLEIQLRRNELTDKNKNQNDGTAKPSNAADVISVNSVMNFLLENSIRDINTIIKKMEAIGYKVKLDLSQKKNKVAINTIKFPLAGQ